MTELINIRPFLESDKATLLMLLRLNTPEYFAVEEEVDFINYLENEVEYYYVIEYKEEIVGCGGINFADLHSTAIISWDILHPDYQGKYLGAKLLEFRIKKIKLIGTVNKIIVRTSQLTYRYYQKQGFKLLEIYKNFWADGFDMYFMEYQEN